jgi:hypothetical protein
MSLLDLLANHFLLMEVAELLSNCSVRALLCVSKAATTNIKRQSPAIYKKMQQIHCTIGFDFYECGIRAAWRRWYVNPYQGAHVNHWWFPAFIRLPLDLEDYFCGESPLFPTGTKIEISLYDIEYITKQSFCARSWPPRKDGMCEQCAELHKQLSKFVVGERPAKRLKTQ